MLPPENASHPNINLTFKVIKTTQAIFFHLQGKKIYSTTREK
jgi:hypothetical protein